jgi:hypothetical protein
MNLVMAGEWIRHFRTLPDFGFNRDAMNIQAAQTGIRGLGQKPVQIGHVPGVFAMKDDEGDEMRVASIVKFRLIIHICVNLHFLG